MGYGRGSKHGDKRFDRILGIGISDLLMNLMSCHVFLKNINTVVALKCPSIYQKYLLFWNAIIIIWNFRMVYNKELMQKK